MEKYELADLRRSYTRDGLSDGEIEDDPVKMFRRWFDEAVHSEVMEPNAMSLATAGSDGVPSVRLVLLKGIEDSAISFFTNYESDKALEIEQNRTVAVSFWWPELERQVRMKGKAEKMSRSESEEYFQSRPRESQIGAWVSDQSRPIESRDELKERQDEIIQKFEGKTVPTPLHWGGYRIILEEIEFWQGRPARLHDRIVYKKENGVWKFQRLQP